MTRLYLVLLLVTNFGSDSDAFSIPPPSLLLSLSPLSTSLSSSSSSLCTRTQLSEHLLSQPLDSAQLREQLGAAGVSSSSSSPPPNGEYEPYYYALRDEHEILCPSTGRPRGFLCTIDPSPAGSIGDVGARSIANVPDVARHVGIAGSVAAALQNRNQWGQCYYMPLEALVRRSKLPVDAVPQGWLDEARKAGKCVIYAENTCREMFTATSDVYVASPEDRRGDAWRMSVDYRVAHINPKLFPNAVPPTPIIRFAEDASLSSLSSSSSR